MCMFNLPVRGRLGAKINLGAGVACHFGPSRPSLSLGTALFPRDSSITQVGRNKRLFQTQDCRFFVFLFKLYKIFLYRKILKKKTHYLSPFWKNQAIVNTKNGFE